jgi:cytidylate kinase
LINKKINIVAIDGPAGSGKSTVAKGVAKKLGYLYIDTGAMYRALTLKALKENIDIHNEDLLIELSRNLDIKLETKDGSLKVFLDGKDVTEEIRTLPISQKVKFIARVKGVRQNMVGLQRTLAQNSTGSVMEGRDIGTVVFPDAKYKFYLDASIKERVGRRFKEFESKGVNVSLADIEKDVRERDHTDKTRDVAPLKKSEAAVCIDTTSMTVEEVVIEVLNRIK